MARVDFVYNPISGSFREPVMRGFVTALEEVGFDVLLIPTEADGVRLSGSADLICVHGGDGTLRDTVQSLGDRAGDTPLCIARAGTINLVARELDYPTDPRAFARRIADGFAKGAEGWLHSPLYSLGSMPIVSCLSIGPDSHAVARVSGAMKKRIGRYAYVLAMLQQMREWPRNVMTISGELSDGTSFACEAEAVIASHGALYAGPFRLSPKAALGEDSIELITLRRSTRLGMLAFSLAAILRISVNRFDFVEIRSVRRVVFDRCVTPVQVDGDHMPECSFAIGASGRTLKYVV